MKEFKNPDISYVPIPNVLQVKTLEKYNLENHDFLLPESFIKFKDLKSIKKEEYIELANNYDMDSDDETFLNSINEKRINKVSDISFERMIALIDIEAKLKVIFLIIINPFRMVIYHYIHYII